MKKSNYSAVVDFLALTSHESDQARASREFKLAYGIFDGLLNAYNIYDLDDVEEENIETKTLNDYEDKEYIALATISLDSFCEQIADDIYDSLFSGLNLACERHADYSDLEAWYDFTDYISREEFAVLLKKHLLQEKAVATVDKDGIKYMFVTIEYPLQSLKEYAELYASRSVKLRIWDIK